MSAKLNKYHGPGIIKQVPATKRYFIKKGDPLYGRVESFMKGQIYRGVNENGGRKIPQNTIGAAYRGSYSTSAPWERGIEDPVDVRVRLSITDSQVTLSPEIDND
jgi:hypothetical protein